MSDSLVGITHGYSDTPLASYIFSRGSLDTSGVASFGGKLEILGRWCDAGYYPVKVHQRHGKRYGKDTGEIR